MSFYTDTYLRIWGNKDVKTATVTSANNGIVINLEDSTSYTIALPSKPYKWDDVRRKSELVDEINARLRLSNAKVECYIGGVSKDTKYDCLVFRATGNYKVSSVAGTFTDEFFK
ncbi:hypothetical protein D3P07_00700 [Paenibacillus sp. 1011MAR3C5]|uniref:hypothetical protein n=1 Tax=Paenibacillus sp. 1011MAR3C5 TaxID=1675787 RepID=UPI000E6CC037|nr:hypothetical protein [Paenibacillus sp. 1011MAR3C5]RJE90663.1 hypothetical protein D3P07_00700 [Paenibacillus sp. 1011MAR3C5]